VHLPMLCWLQAGRVHCTCVQDAHACTECTWLCDTDARWAQCTPHASSMHTHAQSMPAYVRLTPRRPSALRMHLGCTPIDRMCAHMWLCHVHRPSALRIHHRCTCIHKSCAQMCLHSACIPVALGINLYDPHNTFITSQSVTFSFLFMSSSAITFPSISPASTMIHHIVHQRTTWFNHCGHCPMLDKLIFWFYKKEIPTKYKMLTCKIV
jgi:hypothetical protein